MEKPTKSYEERYTEEEILRFNSITKSRHLDINSIITERLSKNGSEEGMPRMEGVGQGRKISGDPLDDI